MDYIVCTEISELEELVQETGHLLKRSKNPVEIHYDAGYRILDINGFIVAGHGGGYGLNLEEVVDWLNDWRS